MTTLNNFKSTTIRGLLRNSDFPDGSELADAIFDRDITVNNNINASSLTANDLYCNNMNSSANDLNLTSNTQTSSFDASGNFMCNHIAQMNNFFNSNYYNEDIVENRFAGKVYGNNRIMCKDGFFVVQDVNNINTVYGGISSDGSITSTALITNSISVNGNSFITSSRDLSVNSITVNGTSTISSTRNLTVNTITGTTLTLTNVLKPNTTISPTLSTQMGFIDIIGKSTFVSSISNILTTVSTIVFNNTTYSFGTYAIKFCFSGSGSVSQTLTYCINTAPNLYTNKNAKHTTNTNISCHHYDMTFNIYSVSTLYFLAQTSTGTYTISDGYIEIVRIA